MIVVIQPAEELANVVRRIADELPSNRMRDKGALHQAADKLMEVSKPQTTAEKVIGWQYLDDGEPW